MTILRKTFAGVIRNFFAVLQVQGLDGIAVL